MTRRSLSRATADGLGTRVPGRSPGLHAFVGLILLVLSLQACASARGRERGVASWYGPAFHGKATASGEIYDMEAMTAAHRTLPFDTIVDVHNLDNGRTVRVRINDRGPFVKGRIIDLSRAAAREIGMLGPGTARVELILLEPTVRVADSPRYTVQVGAFRERHNAEQLQRRLQGDFEGVDVISSGGLHRVRVGLFARRSAAEKLVAELASRRYDAVVVALPPTG